VLVDRRHRLSGQGGSREVPVSIIVVASEGEAAQVNDAAQRRRGFCRIGAAASRPTPPRTIRGYMGMIDPAQLRPELRDVLQGVRARGQISGIAKIPSGYAILKSPERTSGWRQRPRYCTDAGSRRSVRHPSNS